MNNREFNGSYPHQEILIYAVVICKDHEGEYNEHVYEVLRKEKGSQLSTEEYCEKLYKSKSVRKLYALDIHRDPPGILIYSSGMDDICLKSRLMLILIQQVH